MKIIFVNELYSAEATVLNLAGGVPGGADLRGQNKRPNCPKPHLIKY